MSFLSQVLQLSPDKPSKWEKALTEAEKVVGYPTSFLNLRWLLSDEYANVAFNLKKLIGLRHPLLTTAKKLLLSRNAPAWGLVILLISKAAGLKGRFPLEEYDSSSGLLYKHRALAEITEMLRTGNFFHKGILNVNCKDENLSDAYFGNKMALLLGDNLFSTAFKELSNLRNQEVTELMSSAHRDLAQCEFFGSSDQQNKPLPSKPNLNQEDVEIKDPFDATPYCTDGILGNVKAEWTLRHTFAGASLLGKACSSALLLSGHNKEKRKLAYSFGKNLALAWQAHHDVLPFSKNLNEKFCLLSAPIMLHLEYEPEFYLEFIENLKNIDNFDFEEGRKRVLSGNALKRTDELEREHLNRALKNLEMFERSDATDALENILKSVKDV